jgi:hypothetical protein
VIQAKIGGAKMVYGRRSRMSPESGYPAEAVFLTPRRTRYGLYVDAPAVNDLLVVPVLCNLVRR